MNKIKYNLKNVHYAKITTDDSGVVTFEKPVPIPGAVSLSLDAQGEVTPFYADGITFYKAAANNGYDGDLEIALVPEIFRTEILGEKLDSQKVLIENAEATGASFALLFEFTGDSKAIRHVLYNCVSTRPSLESQTKEDKIEPVTEKLKISATPLANGNVKAKTGNETDQAAYNNWYKAVYETPEEPVEE